METTGTVISASRQWWLKVNTKPVRRGTMDGATFPYIIRIQYTVNGTDYIKRKWIGAGQPVPAVGSTVRLSYDDDKPSKVNVLGYSELSDTK